METVERERSQLAAIKIFTDFIKTYTHFENTAKASPSALEEAHASEGLMEIKVTPKYSLDLGEAPAPAPGESSPASPVWGRRWRECTAGPCPRSCGGRRSRCTSSGACEGHRKGITAPEWVRLGQGPNTTGRGTPDPPVEHVEVEPGEHALARPTGREGAAPAHHHVHALPRLGAELELRRSGSSLGPSQ